MPRSADGRAGGSRRRRPARWTARWRASAPPGCRSARSAKTRPRTSSATSPPSSVVPDRNAMPAPAPTSSAPSDRHGQVAGERRAASTERAGQHDGHAEPAAPGQRPDDHRAEPDAERQADEDARRRACRTRRRRRRASWRRTWRVPTTMPPPANAPKMPSTRPRTSGVWPTYAQPSTNSRNMLCSARSALAGAAPADLLDAEEHHQRGGQPGERDEVERELGRLGPALAGRRR